MHVSIKDKLNRLVTIANANTVLTRNDYEVVGIGNKKPYIARFGWAKNPSKPLQRIKRTSPQKLPNPRAFNSEQVAQIRELRRTQKLSYRALSKKYGVSKDTIFHAVRGKGAYREFQRA